MWGHPPKGQHESLRVACLLPLESSLPSSQPLASAVVPARGRLVEAVSVETDDAAALPATVRFCECTDGVDVFCSESGGAVVSKIFGNG